jgi:hypothetical protein
MELCLFEGLNRAERHAVMMCLKHDPLACGSLKPEYPKERLNNVVHTIYSIVMEQDLVAGNRGSVLF